MSRLAFTLAVLLLALLPAAPTAAAKLPPGFVGITSEDVFAGDSNYRTSSLSTQSAIGVQLARQTFDWSQIEKAPGVYDLSFYDSYVAQASAHGVRILPILFKAPSFHVSRPQRQGRLPAALERLLLRLCAGARAPLRAKGDAMGGTPGVPKHPITAWQIWNEPNLARLLVQQAERQALRRDAAHGGQGDQQGRPRAPRSSPRGFPTAG